MSVCRRCAAVFDCCMVEGAAEPCWCTRLPVLPAEALVTVDQDGQGGSCYCPVCLRELVSERDIHH
jgi:hypothetical protein